VLRIKVMHLHSLLFRQLLYMELIV